MTNGYQENIGWKEQNGDSGTVSSSITTATFEERKEEEKKNAMWAHTGISKGFISELGTIPGCNCSAVQLPYRAAVRCLEGKDESYRIPGNRALDANCRLEQTPWLEARVAETVRASRLSAYSTSLACHIIQARFITLFGLQFH